MWFEILYGVSNFCAAFFKWWVKQVHRKFFKTCEHYYFAIFLWLVRSLRNFSIEGKVVHTDSLSHGDTQISLQDKAWCGQHSWSSVGVCPVNELRSPAFCSRVYLPLLHCRTPVLISDVFIIQPLSLPGLSVGLSLSEHCNHLPHSLCLCHLFSFWLANLLQEFMCLWFYWIFYL